MANSKRKRGCCDAQELRSDTSKALTEWTSSEEVEKIVLPYVNQVIQKARDDVYKSPSEVLADYRIMNILRRKLTEEKDMLPVTFYINEYFYRQVLKKIAKMMLSFSAMLSDPALKDNQRRRIDQLLKEEKSDAQEILQGTEECITELDAAIRNLDRDVQSKVLKQIKKKIKKSSLKKIHFNQNDFKANMQQFEKLKCEYSRTEEFLTLLGKHASIYYRTLRRVDDSTLLEKTFYKLQPKKEDYLLWNAELQAMRAAAGKRFC